MSAAPPVYAQARAETAAMLGYDLASLTAEQATRLDVAAALRLAVDDQSGKLARGETADVTKLLSASEALARLLPPLREPPPSVNRVDPRTVMWETYLGMRRRGELADPTSTYEGRGRRIAELEAEIAALKAGAPAPPSDVPEFVESVPVPAAKNVVPLKPPSAPAAGAAPQYDYNRERGWRDYVLPDGTITPTPFGGGRKYWGPV